jgi:hypothetical protein
MDMPALLNIFKLDMLVNLCSLYPCCTSVSSHAYSTNVTAARQVYFVSGEICLVGTASILSLGKFVNNVVSAGCVALQR